ncbi:hypothetical protein TB1_024883 [Malus domestica]
MNMGRGRLNMELIANERSRKTTFQKRRKGIMKKAYEFSTLCEVDVCMIIYGPKLTDRPPELQTWPKNPEEVNRIINKYKASTMCKPPKKTFDLSDLLMDRKNKVYADIYRKRKEMYETKYPAWDERINTFSESQLEALLNALDGKLESGKRTFLNRKKEAAGHQILVMKKEAPTLLMGGNLDVGESSSRKHPCNYEEDQNHMSSFSNNMVDHILQQYPHQPCDQMLQFDNSNVYLSNLLAPNPGPTAMWMLRESNYSLQFSAGASGSNSEFPVAGNQGNFSDPIMIHSTVENTNMNMVMVNNNLNPPRSSYMSQQYYDRLMQPAVPYMQYPVMPASISSHPVQLRASQAKDDQYQDINHYLWS